MGQSKLSGNPTYQALGPTGFGDALLSLLTIPPLLVTGREYQRDASRLLVPGSVLTMSTSYLAQ
jgi:hypothetical protein